MIPDFNSTLVQLEVRRWDWRDNWLLISIPLWFNWKNRRHMPRGQDIQFQFHSGSIGRQLSWAFWPYWWLFQFHSGSIGRRYQSLSSALSEISIPLWFNWKYNNAEAFALCLLRFQFHSGSIGSPRYYKDRFFTGISIPLWFNWKQCQVMESALVIENFNSTLVQLEAA